MIGFVIIMQKKIIIDTDPGQDDAVAILLALASPNELNVSRYYYCSRECSVKSYQ